MATSVEVLSLSRVDCRLEESFQAGLGSWTCGLEVFEMRSHLVGDTTPSVAVLPIPNPVFTAKATKRRVKSALLIQKNLGMTSQLGGDTCVVPIQAG